MKKHHSHWLILSLIGLLTACLLPWSVQAQGPTAAPALPETPSAQPDLASLGLSGQIAYPAFDVQRRTFDIYLADLHSGQRTLLVSEASAPDLRNDGQFIAYRSWQPQSRGLFAQKTSGEFRRRLTAQPFAEDLSPAWSPDGESIAFASRRQADGRPRLYLAWPGGMTDWSVMTDGGGAEGDAPAWLSAGRLVFSGCVAERCGLVAMDEDGTDVRALTDHPSDRSPAVSPDGMELVFMSQRDGNWDIYWVPAKGGKPMRLTDDPADDGLPAWSPGGQYVTFVSNRGGRWALWLMKSNGASQQMLFALEGPLQSDLPGQSWLDERLSWVSSGAEVEEMASDSDGVSSVPPILGVPGKPCRVTLLRPEVAQNDGKAAVARFRWQVSRPLAVDEYYVLFLGGLIDGKPHVKGSFKDAITDERGPWPLDVLETLIPFMELEPLREPVYETTVPSVEKGQLHWEIQVRKTGRQGLAPSPVDAVVCQADAAFVSE